MDVFGERFQSGGFETVGHHAVRSVISSSGQILHRQSRVNGELDDPHGPALIRRTRNGIVDQENWARHGRSHRDDGPAFITRFHDTGAISNELWYQFGKMHRVDGPAMIQRDRSGTAISEVWLQFGEFHRENGPASIKRTEAGLVYREEWYRNGRHFREDGPAEIWRDAQTGEITKSVIWPPPDSRPQAGLLPSP